jgi:hypothetical protein
LTYVDKIIVCDIIKTRKTRKFTKNKTKVTMDRTEVVNLMKGSNSESEWNNNCSLVKKACNGYPDFWYEAIIASGVAKKTVERFGGSTDISISTRQSRPIANLYGRPTSMPYTLQKGEDVVGVYDQGLGDKRKICKNLEEMQELYDWYAKGWALTLRWEIETICETTLKS